MLRKMLLTSALAAAVTVMAAPSYAQAPFDQTTFFTFSAPFELPGGKVLPAGKYTFKIADTPGNRHIVQILSEDRSQVHATILAIPAERQEPPEEPEVRFMEAAASQPPAIRTWWYPGRTIGHEFIYPKDQARRLASAQTESVLTVDTDATDTDGMRTADLSRVDAAGTQTAEAEAEAEAAADARQARADDLDREEPRATPAPRVDDTRADRDFERTELPRTASVMPLVGLIGLVSLAGAAFLRRRR